MVKLKVNTYNLLISLGVLGTICIFMLSIFKDDYMTFTIGTALMLISSFLLFFKKKIYKGVDVFIVLIILLFLFGSIVFLIYTLTNKTVLFPPYIFTESMIKASLRSKFALSLAIFMSYVIATRLTVEQKQYFFYKLYVYSAIILAIALISNWGVLKEILMTPRRFKGFSFRPTQLAGVLSLIFFIGFHPSIRQRFKKWVFALIVFILALASLLTESEGLWLSIIVTIIIAILTKTKRYLYRRNKRKTIILIIYTLLIFILLSPFLSYSLFYLLEDSRGQASGRFKIWYTGLEAVLYSPFVGYGPGSYSGVHGAPFAGKDSHNTIIDFLGYGGVFFITLMGYIYYKIFSKIKTDNYFVLALISLSIYGLFHNVGRAPYFWILVFLLYETRGYRSDNKLSN